MTTKLSPPTQQLIEILFKQENQEAASKMLIEECGQNLPFMKDADEFRLERFRFAALKISNGDLSMLRKAVNEAKRDWRDLLVWAGFANSLIAHDQWAELTIQKHEIFNK